MLSKQSFWRLLAGRGANDQTQNHDVGQVGPTNPPNDFTPLIIRRYLNSTYTNQIASSPPDADTHRRHYMFKVFDFTTVFPT